MKILKLQQVDSVTGISIGLKKSLNGPAYPQIPGLNIIFLYKNWVYAYADDSATENPDNLIFEIDNQQLSQDINVVVNNYLDDWRLQVYAEEKELRKAILGKYDDTAISSGIYKYNDAKKFLDTGISSLSLDTEAQERGVQVSELASKIVSNHETFIVNEAKISGLRGKILDRLDSYIFNSNDPVDSLNELTQRIEIIGQKENPSRNEDPEVKVGYYSPYLAIRWKYLNS